MQENAPRRRSIGLRLTLVIFLTFILLLPTFLIMAVIDDRQSTRDEAIGEVSDKWGGEQTITGPVLTVPYRSAARDKNGDVVTETRYAHFLPEDLNIEGTISPELRRRGIYEIVVYGSYLKLSGKFLSPDFTNLSVPAGNILWNDAFISLGIPDMQGIQQAVMLTWDNAEYELKPGVASKDIVDSGISVTIPMRTSAQYQFGLELKLNGSRELLFIPVGKQTRVKISSNWPSPSFIGSFLPRQREVKEDGFFAEWQVLNLNRNYPQNWLGSANKVKDSAFGVNLLIAVDQYQRSMRTVKYAILLIGLTFLTFFFVEMFNKTRIHPVQYLLVGFSLCVFYLLLLSISERINFNGAYIISAFVTIAMITVYSRHILKTNLLTILQGLILVLLYGFIYVIMQLEDYALLMGSIGIFIILGIVMYLSKKIDWYGELKNSVKNENK